MKLFKADFPNEILQFYSSEQLDFLKVEKDPVEGVLIIIDGDGLEGCWRDRWLKQKDGKFVRLPRINQV